ncbi:GDSL-type esterase/lipase family protein [Miniimonas sp. S16]|uniref:GDSL-type esterase/lipase family protein n=1 Tax=Miniimonas sp. S16 TaxID=2171623 RepID=UPI00131EFE9B|nr:GDSL-type esterase/lipase family protein [Miniimonas sp. S16]
MTARRALVAALLALGTLGALGACSPSQPDATPTEVAPTTPSPAVSSTPEPATAQTATPDQGAAPSDTATASGEPDALRVLAVGDSISTGFNTCQLLTRCDSTWLTGPDGVTERLAGEGYAPTLVLAALEGATLADAPALVDQALAADPGEVDLVVVLLGANDVCAGTDPSATSSATSPEATAAGTAALLDHLAAVAPHAPVAFLSPPDVVSVWDAAHTDPVAQRAWAQWRVCASALGSDDAARQATAQRVADLTATVAAACAARERCVSDGGAIAALDLTAADLSPNDWFHPSAQGQRDLAVAAWPTVQAAAALVGNAG